MKKLLFAILLGAILSTASAQSGVDTLTANHPEYLSGLAVGSAVPKLSAPDTLGKTIRLSDYKGKYVVIDFWASWCKDCRHEIPFLKQLYADYKDVSIKGKALEWLGFSFDTKADTWKSILRKEQFPWTQISKLKSTREDNTFKDFKLNWIPAFLIVDPQGKLVSTAITADGLRKNLEALTTDIKLPAPNLSESSLSVVEALKTRHSVRSFDGTKELSSQQLSNLCWAACGMSRDDNHRTAPTAMNRQEIRLFAFTKTAVYEYDAKKNMLVRKADGDHRDLLASGGGKPANGKSGFRQEFVMDAPVTLLMVIDYDIFGKQDEKAVMMGSVDAGNVSENINLYCQSVGLVTVPRATHDVDGIRQLLGFSEKQLPVMNNPVGYEK